MSRKSAKCKKLYAARGHSITLFLISGVMLVLGTLGAAALPRRKFTCAMIALFGLAQMVYALVLCRKPVVSLFRNGLLIHAGLETDKRVIPYGAVREMYPNDDDRLVLEVAVRAGKTKTFVLDAPMNEADTQLVSRMIGRARAA